MNDELNLTDDQIHLATSRSLPADVQLDSDTGGARDAFFSLGASVESAASNFDEAALLARLKQSCLDTPVVVPQRTATPRDWLSLILTGALAAAGLIAIVRIVSDSNSTGTQVATIDTPLLSPVFPSIGTSPTRFTLAWNDPLDDEIALAAANLEQFAGRARGFDDSLLDMNDRLEALSQELSKETL